MNNLSWFLYFIDVFTDIDWILTVLFFISVFIGIVGIFIWVGSQDSTRENREEGNRLFIRCFKISVPLFFLTSILLAFIPNEKTMYLILGSEAAEEVVTSETGKRIQRIINERLDGYLEVADEVVGRVSP